MVDGFGGLLRTLREARALTQDELAERAGVTVKAVGALERGERRRPYPHTVRALADALDAGPDERAALIASVPARARPAADPPPAPAPVGPPPAPVFGRDADVDAVAALLRAGDRPVVTLTGLGGVGKTTLALAVARRVRGGFPGGVVVVELAGVRDAAGVLPAVAAALGVPESGFAGTAPALAPYLSGRRTLLVLDNLEHVIGCAPEIAALAARCPEAGFLATSQVPMRIRAEREVRVEPLEIGPAVALFRDRAAAVGRPVPDSPELAEICRRLEGIPLAVELAASASALLGPVALLDRLDALPASGPRDLPDRQRTMAACLDRSHRMLAPPARELLGRLSVFAGGFSLAGAEAVGGAPAVDGLRELLDHSLVVRTADVHGTERFRLLEPVRRHAADRLVGDDRAAALDRHLRHVRGVVRDLAPDLRGPHLHAALDLLTADHADLRLAVDRLDGGQVAEFVHRLWLYLALRGRAREGLAWLERTAGPPCGEPAEARRLVATAGLAYVTGAVPAVRAAAGAALVITRRLGDDELHTEALVLAASGALFAGDLAGAAALLDTDPPAGRPPWGRAHLLITRGQLALLGADLDGADRWLREADAAARVLGNAFTLATTLNIRATLAVLRAEDAAAALQLAEAAELSVTTGMSWTLAYTLPALAGVAVRLGDAATGARLFGSSASYGARHDVDAAFPADRAVADRELATARDALGPERFRRAWDAGRDATAVDVVELARTLSERARG